MKKRLILLIAVCLSIMPMAALAEPAAQRVTLTVRDPYLQVGTPGEAKPTNVVDLTGLSLSFEGSIEDEILSALITLSAGGAPAAQALMQLGGAGLTAALSGMEHAAYVPMESLAEQFPGFPGAGDSLDALLKAAEGVEIVDEGLVEAEFYGGGRLAARKQSFTLTDAQLRALIEAMDMGLPVDDMPRICVTGALYGDDGGEHLRVEYNYHIEDVVTKNGEEAVKALDIPVTVTAYLPGDALYAAIQADATEGTRLVGNLMATPSAAMPELLDIFGELTVYEDDDEVEGQVELIGWPAETSAGTEYTLSLNVHDGDEGDAVVALNAHALIGPQAVAYSFGVDPGEGEHLMLRYDADVVENGLNGTLSFDFLDRSSALFARVGIDCATSGEPVSVDLGGYTPIDVTQLTEEQGELLADEAQATAMRVVGALMQIPGVQALFVGRIF